MPINAQIWACCVDLSSLMLSLVSRILSLIAGNSESSFVSTLINLLSILLVTLPNSSNFSSTLSNRFSMRSKISLRSDSI